jgi:hypothetical protein
MNQLSAHIPMVQHGWADAAMIGAIVVFATIGDVMIAAAMRAIGDLDDIKAVRGLSGAILAVLGSMRFVTGVVFMALSFFSLLFALSHADLSLAHLRDQRRRREDLSQGKCRPAAMDRRRLRMRRRRPDGPLVSWSELLIPEASFTAR